MSNDKQVQANNAKSIWRNWGLIASISVYCIWSLHDMAYAEAGFSLKILNQSKYY
jgi:hypothetical protein